MSKKIVLASNNPGKLKEFRTMFSSLDWELITQGELGIDSADEPYFTFVENALAKARHASKAAKMPALADDSGLVVPALNSAPGVLSARYAASIGGAQGDAANNQALINSLQSHHDRRAYYVAVLVYVESATDPCPLIVQAFWHGEIATTAKGENGFGYDPYFYIPELGKHVAELSMAEKNSSSHRAKALRKLLLELQDHA